MARRISARGEAVRSLVLGVVFVLALAAPGGAQPPPPPPPPCLDFVCNAVLACAEGAPQCSPGGCICRPACNSDSDCGNGRLCEGGLCVGRLPESCSDNSHCPSSQICFAASGTCFAPCNNRGDCPRGQVCRDGRCGTCSADSACSSTESCVRGLCERRPTPAPECASNRDCDDGYPCNGEEICDMSVCRSGPRPCTAEPPSIARCVVEPPGSGCFHCEVTARGFRPIEGEIEVSEEPVSLPPGVGPGRGETGPIQPPGSGKGSGFRVRGVLRAPLASRPPLDLPSGRLRIVLADQKGRALFDQTVEPRAWTGDLARGYALSGPAGLIRGVRITPKGGKGDYLVEIEGIAADPALAKHFGRDVRPVLALTLEWKDAASTVAVAELGDCSKQRARGRAPQALRCKSKGYASAAGSR